MRLIDADALLAERKKSVYYHLPNGDIAIPIIDIEHAPTVKPEPQWILCSERLPDEKDAGFALKKLGIEKRSEYVLVTVDINGERVTDMACMYDDKWKWIMKHAFPDFKVVAWMPRPKPYVGRGQNGQ